MEAVFTFLSEQHVLFVFLLIGIGMAFGHVKVRGISLGAAAVLFTALGLTAWALANGVVLTVPHEIGTLGLALFAFAIGINSGPGAQATGVR